LELRPKGSEGLDKTRGVKHSKHDRGGQKRARRWGDFLRPQLVGVLPRSASRWGVVPQQAAKPEREGCRETNTRKGTQAGRSEWDITRKAGRKRRVASLELESSRVAKEKSVKWNRRGYWGGGIKTQKEFSVFRTVKKKIRREVTWK